MERGGAVGAEGWRRGAARLSATVSRFETALLVLAAAAPYVPGAWQFIQRGVPEVLLTGDAGTLELRVLHASHGTQLLGPYSRFSWSHPGPAFFYLALPLYETFHEHGPALNLFAFIANLLSAIAIALSARRLGGRALAFGAAALLAVYECIDPPFPLSAEWNPLTPIIPLALLSLFAARMGNGDLSVLPAFAFIGSAAMQTHVGFTPVVLSLSVVAAGFWGVSRWTGWPKVPPPERGSPWRTVRTLGWTAGALSILWMLPLVENATSPEGNLTRLVAFFTSPHPAEHTWALAADTVAAKIAALPQSIVRLFGFVPHPSTGALRAIAVVEVEAVVVALAVGLRRRDGAAVVLSSIALVEMATAVVAVHAIRGDIWSHLTIWITIVSWVAMVAGIAAVRALIRPLARSEAATAVYALLLLLVLGRCVTRESAIVDVFRGHEPDAEALASGVLSYLTTERLDHPVIRVATGDQWPIAVAVVVHIFKNHIPIWVEPSLLFLMGDEFAEKAPDHPRLVIGDRAFFESVRDRPDYRLIANGVESFAFLAEPDYVRDHRIAESPRLISATGVVGDPARAVDGVIPPQGTRWDSPLSVVLNSTDSAIEVTVPDGGADGVFLSADGSDTYAILCGSDQGKFALGGILAGVPIGMGTGLLVSPKLRSCRTITVKPASGDGYYSVGEIGFVRPQLTAP